MPEQEIGIIEGISIIAGESGETISIPAIKVKPGAFLNRNMTIHVMGPSTNHSCEVTMIEVNGLPVARAAGPCFADIGWRNWDDVRDNDSVTKGAEAPVEGEAGG